MSGVGMILQRKEHNFRYSFIALLQSLLRGMFLIIRHFWKLRRNAKPNKLCLWESSEEWRDGPNKYYRFRHLAERHVQFMDRSADSLNSIPISTPLPKPYPLERCSEGHQWGGSEVFWSIGGWFSDVDGKSENDSVLNLDSIFERFGTRWEA